MDNADDESSLVKTMSITELNRREAEVEGRIKRKLLALSRLTEGGRTRVIISDGRTEKPISDALDGKGTIIQ